MASRATPLTRPVAPPRHLLTADSRGLTALLEETAAFSFSFFGLFGGVADVDGGENDDEGYEGRVEELADELTAGLAEDLVEEVLDGGVPGEGGDEAQSGGYEGEELVKDFSGQRSLLPVVRACRRCGRRARGRIPGRISGSLPRSLRPSP